MADSPNLGYFTNREFGYPPAPPPAGGNLPPGGGGYTTPFFLEFSSMVRSAARAYTYKFDEAIRDSRVNALAMERDAVLWAALRNRQMPTSQLSWHVEPRDETDPAQAEAAKLVTSIIEEIPRFQQMKMLLLEALWFGRYAVQVVYDWQDFFGKTCLTVRDFTPINGDSLRFKWDGTPGVLVNSTFPGDWEATDWGMAHFLTPGERQQYIIHHHEPRAPDWTEGDMAGAVQGVGLRGRLYWFWFLKQQVFGMLMNYLERFSNGLTIIYYAAHDPAAQAAAQAMATAGYVNNTLTIPRWNTENPDLNKVERLEVGTASPALLEHLVTDYFDNVMTKAILGQTLSSDAAATGLGSGVADLHGETLDEIIKYDAVNLGETLQTDLVNVLYRWNCKGVRPGRFSFEVDTPNAEAVLGYAQILYQMGMSLDEDQLYEVSQLTRPVPGSGVVSQLGQMQPAAVGPMPPGVPVAGAPAASGIAGGMPAGGGQPAMLPAAQAYRRNGVVRKKSLPKRRLVLARG